MQVARDSSERCTHGSGTMAHIAFIMCCVEVVLTLTGCGDTTGPASPTSTAVAETISTATPSSEPSQATEKAI